MYAVIRKYPMERGQVSELARDVNEHFLPKVSEIPGFVSYYLLDTGNGLATVSVFETKEGTAESTRRAADYVKGLENVQVGKPEITEGEVRVHRAVEHAGGHRH